jgi:gamma-glutamyltranspeptidase/glutathione hydrolase/leukotriene-C4 hydrolase
MPIDGFAARTRVCDPAFSDDLDRIARIPSEEYADAIIKNVTDDRTHEAAYYQPEYDVKVDHGTVGYSL